MSRLVKAIRRGFGNLGMLLASTLVVLLVLEGAIRLFDLFPGQRAALLRPSPPVAEEGEAPVTLQRLHPFLGWEPPVSNDYLGLEESDFVVGIFGGSVAGMLVSEASDAVIRALEHQEPRLKDNIQVLQLGRGAYKQPQQLFLLLQLIMLKVPFDVIVNLDGFNEVALGATDGNNGFHPLYPYRNHLAKITQLAASSPTTAQIEKTAAILQARRRVETLGRFSDEHPWIAASELVKLVMGRVRIRCDDRVVILEQDLAEIGRIEHADLIASLENPCLGSDFDCWELIGDIWQEASILMAAAAEEIGAVYVHALQPHQYNPGSKFLTEEELAVAYRPDILWSRAAAMGYPHLRRRGGLLRRRGVHFMDLTMLFSDRPETIYRDSCCHYNRLGNELLSEKLAILITSALNERNGR